MCFYRLSYFPAEHYQEYAFSPLAKSLDGALSLARRRISVAVCFSTSFLLRHVKVLGLLAEDSEMEITGYDATLWSGLNDKPALKRP